MREYTPNPDFTKQLAASVDSVVNRAAEASADQLRENVSAGARTGIHYPWMPRRSSAPGEFPQQQSGNLLESVGVANPRFHAGLQEFEYAVGFFGEDMQKLEELEFTGPGKRAPLTMTMLSADTYERMSEGLKRA